MLFCHSRRCLFKNARGFQVILNMHRESQYQPPFPLRETTFSPRFWEKGGRGGGGGGRKKMRVRRDLSTSCHRYLSGGLLFFVSKKTLKSKYGFEGSISSVDLGLRYPGWHLGVHKACNRLTSINRLNMKITTKVLMFVFSKWWPLHW